MKAITAVGIEKAYGKKKSREKALKGLSFEVEKGELFGIIGPDGAGKTSLFRILTTLLLPDNGKATVDGFDIVKDYRFIRQRVGYMPGRFSLYQDLTVEENLKFFASVYKTTIDENYDLIKDIYAHIEPFKSRIAGKLSGGMKQKLALCCALIHRPSILFLDEPTTGVDSVSRKEFWNMLQRLKMQEITVMVSTPYMDEAGMCDRVALIQNGLFLSIDTPEALVKQFEKPLYAAKSSNMILLLNELISCEEVIDTYSFGEYHHVVLKDLHAASLLKGHLSKLFPDVDFIPVKPNIEDCFIALMQNQP